MTVREKNRPRGRPKDDRETRKGEILDAAMKEFSASGYQKATSLAVAKACGMSKSTLYAYFPSKEDLFIALIQKRAAALNSRLGAGGDYPYLTIVEALKNIARGVLEILTSDDSIALNRIAMSTAGSQDTGFSTVYEEHGRKPSFERVEAMLANAHRRGDLIVENIHTARQDLYGLLLGDLHIRLLLGVAAAPGDKQIDDMVEHAVGHFMMLYGPHAGRA